MLDRFIAALPSLGWWGIALIAAAVWAVYWVLHALYEARYLHVVRDEVWSPRLPQVLDGLKVAFVADIHAGPYFGAARMADLVSMLNGLGPDIVILGGDYVGGQLHGARVFYPAVRELRPRLAKLAVMGNHDVREGEAEAREGLALAGITLLENSSVTVGHSGQCITIAGLEDLYTGDPDVRRAAREIDPDGFAILVSHNPDAFDWTLPLAEGTFDLALAGHTHGGQITAFGAWAPILPSRFGQRYRTGWRTEGGVPILVTNGIGTVTAPLRYFARPELNLITLHHGPERWPGHGGGSARG